MQSILELRTEEKAANGNALMSRELSCASDVARCREGSGQRLRWYKVAATGALMSLLRNPFASFCCNLLICSGVLTTARAPTSSRPIV